MKKFIITQFLPELITDDGTIVRLCPLDRTKGILIYCSHAGLFFSYAAGVLKEVNPYANRHFKSKRNVHSDYPKLQHYLGNARCHMLMALTWLGPQPGKNYVVDHINGNIFDWNADNLQWVTPKENHRRARYLRVMRACGFDPRIFSTKDLLYWFSMPFDEFKTFFNHYKND